MVGLFNVGITQLAKDTGNKDRAQKTSYFRIFPNQLENSYNF